MALLAANIYNDPRIVELRERVRSCVESQGYEFHGLPLGFEKPMPYLEQLSVLMASGPQGELDSQSIGFGYLTPEQRSVLAELQALETVEALAAYDCGAAQLDEIKAEVSPKYELDFLDAHRDALASYRDRIQDLRSKYNLPQLGE